MLWQKENKTNSYVDLLGSESYPLTNLRLNRKKSDSLSSKARANGNEKYREKEFQSSMYLYNESICFAQSSKNLSLGYANRSNCFFGLGLYERCLSDIQLAKDAGYPEHLLPKLEGREKICKELMKVQPQQLSNEDVYNFEADSIFPSMANALVIQKNSHHGRFVAARRDIEIGETLIVEEAYVHVIYNKDLKECSNCGKEQMNFIPCRNCADTMFCNSDCENNNFHKTECGMAMHSVDHVGGESSVFLLRSIVVAITTFSSIQELMEIVEKINSEGRSGICESMTSPQKKYEAFFKLSSIITKQKILDYRKKAYIIFHAIISSSIGSKFSKTEEKRFLVHLIIHHGLILRSNSFQREFGDDFEMKLNLLTSYLNHCCIPNVTILSRANLTVAKSILPILKGQELFISYVDRSDEDSHTDVNDQLEKIYGFRCECISCRKDKPEEKELLPMLQSDPSFLYIEQNISSLRKQFDSTLLCNLKEHAKKFLSKNPCETKESKFVSSCLSEILQIEFTTPAKKA